MVTKIELDTCPIGTIADRVAALNDKFVGERVALNGMNWLIGSFQVDEDNEYRIVVVVTRLNGSFAGKVNISKISTALTKKSIRR